MAAALDDDSSQPTHNLRWSILALLTVLATAATVAPTLVWQQFSSGAENLVTATALEIRRGDCGWLVPTLQGEPRVAKPPLAAWIAAASIRPATVAQLSSTDAETREGAHRALALQVRWPALLVACLWLAAIFELGRTIRNARAGALAALAAASSFFFLRYARYQTTDIHLALWVTIANLCLAKWIVRGRTWTGCLGAGIALGLAMMSKGPVSLVQSVLPVVAYGWLARRDIPDAPRRRMALPIVSGIALMLLIGGAWFVIVAAGTPNVWHLWFREVTRIGATDAPPNAWYAYFGVLAYLLPWSVFLIVGLVAIVRDWRASRHVSPEVLALLMLTLPIIVMSFAKDRQDRYVLPMLAPAAVVIAIGIEEHLRSWSLWTHLDTLATTIHWLILAAVLVAFPLVGASEYLIAVDGRPWFRPDFAGPIALIGALIVVAGIFVHRKWAGGLLVATMLAMLLAQAVAFRGYVNSEPGRSEMKDLADAIVARYPTCVAFNAHPRAKRPSTDLSVYLNRVVRHTTNPAALSSDGTAPLILFLVRDKGEPEPVPPPGGWRYFGKAERGSTAWYAFVLPPG